MRRLQRTRVHSAQLASVPVLRSLQEEAPEVEVHGWAAFRAFPRKTHVEVQGVRVRPAEALVVVYECSEPQEERWKGCRRGREEWGWSRRGKENEGQCAGVVSTPSACSESRIEPFRVVLPHGRGKNMIEETEKKASPSGALLVGAAGRVSKPVRLGSGRHIFGLLGAS